MPAVSVNPDLLRWAINRSGLLKEDLQQKFPKLDEWLSGDKDPTLKQLEAFAKRTMTPFGYMLLSKAPKEQLPIPDFRTVGDSPINRPSPNLIDTLHDMQRRQTWMRDHLIQQGSPKLKFVGTAKNSQDVQAVVIDMRATLGLDRADWAGQLSCWEDALRFLRGRIEAAGIMISVCGIVGVNTSRSLDPNEFRGFVLSDPYAPLIFVNGADSKSAQMFTIAHELAHIWIGKDGLFNLPQMMPHDDATENFCNQVAAEFLVPADNLRERWPKAKKLAEPFSYLASKFKVSPLVAARRTLDLGLINQVEFFTFYRENQAAWAARKRKKKEEKKSGGQFYLNQDVRLGKRFAYAVVRAAREGTILYRDAYNLTGLKGKTFKTYADRLTSIMEG